MYGTYATGSSSFQTLAANKKKKTKKVLKLKGLN